MRDDAAAVLDAARQRAAALVSGDEAQLRALMHPELRWTTHRGDVLNCEAYFDGNTNGSLRWLDQRLQDPDVVVIGDTAILTAVVVDTIERTGSTDEFRLRLTQTWVRQDEAWRCVAGHAGPAASGP
jgi:ketosteroid isomerase-like protein